MYYRKAIKFIKKNYKNEQQQTLLRYFNSDAFENDLDKFLTNQANAGERLDKTFAIEAILESYIQLDDDIDDGIYC